MEDVIKVIVAFTLAIIILVVFSLIVALPTMWLWNWLMPVIFGLCRITFWQAFGINLLIGLLFRSTTHTNS